MTHMIHHRFAVFALPLFFALIATPLCLHAAVININSNVATYIRSNVPDTGQDNDPDNEIIAGLTDTNDILRVLFEFDLSSIPLGNQIDSVFLDLTTHPTRSGIGGGQTFNLHAYNFDIDGFATWNDPGVGDSVDGGSLGTLLSSVTFNVESTGIPAVFADSAAFQAAATSALAGGGFLRLILVNVDENPTGAHKFARFPDENIRFPMLNVTHSVPEPSTVVSAFICLLGLGFGVRRHRQGKIQPEVS